MMKDSAGLMWGYLLRKLRMNEWGELIFREALFGWLTYQEATGTVLVSLMCQWEILDRESRRKDMNKCASNNALREKYFTISLCLVFIAHLATFLYFSLCPSPHPSYYTVVNVDVRKNKRLVYTKAICETNFWCYTDFSYTLDIQRSI